MDRNGRTTPLTLVVDNATKTRIVKRKPLLFNPGELKVLADGTGYPREDLAIAVLRFLEGDWGDVTERERNVNDIALRSGAALVGRYNVSDGYTIRIVTDGKRHITEIAAVREPLEETVNAEVERATKTRQPSRQFTAKLRIR